MSTLGRVRGALHRAVEHRLCPDRRYALAGVPDGIDPALLEGARVGPHRCPECASPWPLLPPPTVVP